MVYLLIFFLAVGLSMDAFAVSVTMGATIKNFKLRHKLYSSMSMGLFQGIMPIIGYFVANIFGRYILAIDHYISFALLSVLGVKMIVGAVIELKRPPSEQLPSRQFTYKNLLLLSVATSIDALAAGVSLLSVSVSVFVAAGIISVTTFLFCLVGIFIGTKTQGLFKDKAEIFGGVVLILIGVKILLEHTLL